MTIRFDQDVIRLEGDCFVEDAEPLLSALQTSPFSVVDISAVGILHAAVFQILFALRPKIVGTTGDAFLERWVEPVLVVVPAE